MRGPEHSPLARPHQLLAAARAEDRLADLDRASRDAAMRTADEHGLRAPFALFVNADADTLLEHLPDRAGARSTLVVDGSPPRAPTARRSARATCSARPAPCRPCSRHPAVAYG